MVFLGVFWVVALNASWRKKHSVLVLKIEVKYPDFKHVRSFTNVCMRTKFNDHSCVLTISYALFINTPDSSV